MQAPILAKPKLEAIHAHYIGGSFNLLCVRISNLLSKMTGKALRKKAKADCNYVSKHATPGHWCVKCQREREREPTISTGEIFSRPVTAQTIPEAVPILNLDKTGDI